MHGGHGRLNKRAPVHPQKTQLRLATTLWNFPPTYLLSSDGDDCKISRTKAVLGLLDQPEDATVPLADVR